MTVTKDHILAEITRTARQNEGVPVGQDRFRSETGIREGDWLGKYWARWNDAVTEAGLQPNTRTEAYGEEHLLATLAILCKELGRFPTRSEIMLKRRSDKNFPAAKTFERLGSKAELAARLARFCTDRGGYEDVAGLCVALCRGVERDGSVAERASGRVSEEQFGYVYLLKSGRYYKVGRSNAVGRRERELAIQLPERARVVHSIKTDDPAGIESYWHRRFEGRRRNGEWFELTAEDLSAFKKRKFM